MRTYASPEVAVLVVGLAMLAGVYVVAVLDRAIGERFGGATLHWQRVALEPLRSAALLLMQQRRTTERTDAPGWILAPALLMALAALALALVPLGPSAVAADPDTGFVVFSAAIAFVMIAVYLHGWSPNSVFPLHGAYRFGAQALSFQMPFLLAMLATTLPAESLWNVVRQPLGLPLYLIVGVSVSFWGPMNLPDAADLAGGTSAEDSGVARLLWKAARSAMLVAVAAMGATGFLGGYWGPWLPGAVWIILKTLALLIVMIAAGHLLARVRIEGFVVVAWVLLIPLALLNIFVSGAFLL